jgi:probable F420-dependent oxidoreductase
MSEAAVGGVGVWWSELRYGDTAVIASKAADVESLGYSAMWIPDIGGKQSVMSAVDVLLGATERVTVATGILNVWMQTPVEVCAWWTGLPGDQRDRVLLGIGVSHGPFIGEKWERPLAVMGEYLDGLDAGSVPQERRCLAALGPKMLELARDRSAGAHPYLVTPEHTAEARSILGDAGLFVEQGVILDTDADRARSTARQGLEHYFGLPNYVNTWKRLGFTDDDVATRSDRLIDALVAWGDVDAVKERIEAHRAAGADHVCIQVIAPLGQPVDPADWRTLAPE